MNLNDLKLHFLKQKLKNKAVEVSKVAVGRQRLQLLVVFVPFVIMTLLLLKQTLFEFEYIYIQAQSFIQVVC